MPAGWDAEAHRLWSDGQRGPALQRAIQMVNSTKGAESVPLLAQLGSYLFFLADYGGAAQLLQRAASLAPDQLELQLNLAMVLSRAGEHRAAIATAQAYLARGGPNVMAWDTLCAAYHRTGDDEKARAAGRNAILAKTREADLRGDPLPLGPVPDGWQDKPRVIAFSLWGAQPRYLRGALQNLLVARHAYPGWTCRFLVDSSVPEDLVTALAGQGAQILSDPGEPSLRRRLTRRFDVAADPSVGAFLVRDCDSLVSEREAQAVDQWLKSGRPFHIIRDWWTHTDPILAGMWGGLAGLLPPLAGEVEAYRSGRLETANVDQWFLRDRVWPAIRDQALVHDRLFAAAGAPQIPGPAPTGNRHIGQDEFAVRRAAQAKALEPFRTAVPSLRLGSPPA